MTRPSPVPRDEPRSESEAGPDQPAEEAAEPEPSAAEAAEPEQDHTEDAPGSGRAGDHRGKRRASVLAGLVAVLVLLSAAAVWFAIETNRLRAGDPEANAALVDAGATARVIEQISSAVESIFSYNYAYPERTRRAAERVLLDQALREFEAKLAEASKEAKDRKLIRTANVRAIGVRYLHGDTARVLVFLDQQTLLTAENKQRSNTAYLEILAKRTGGSWKIAKMSGGS